MAGETVLIVEDEAIIALHLQRILTNLGYQAPKPVSTGLAAIRAVDQLRPDLVLMDIKLQGEMNGIEAAQRIRQRHDLPVVYLTAYTDDTRLSEASLTEPYGYLSKPVQEQELHANVSMALYKHRMDRRVKESERHYRELYHNTPAMLQSMDIEGRITQVSDYWLSFFEYERDEVIGRTYSDFMMPESAEKARQLLRWFEDTGLIQDADVQMVKKNGDVVDILFSTEGVVDDYGQMVSALTAMVDITARKQAEAAERDQRTLAEALRDTAAALNATLSLDEVLENVLNNVGRVVPHDAVNIMLVEDGVARVVRLQGYGELGREQAVMSIRLPVEEVFHLRHMAETLQPLVLPDTGQVEHWGPAWIASYAGAPVIFQGRLMGFINLVGLRPNFFTEEQGHRLQAFANQAAVAIENATLYAEVTRLATLDELTGVLNRRRLFELGQREFDRARRYGSPLSALLLDIDHFKKVNDTFGHHTGDHVLASIAALISRSIREVDLFGRYGGEEFVVLLPQTDPKQAEEAAERLRKLVAGLHFSTERGPLTVTISLGIAQYHSSLPSLAALLDRADQAMYTAKQAGRNRVENYQQG